MGEYFQGRRSGAIASGMFGGISLMDLMEMKNLEDEKVGNIYGFSSRGRPLGSEPVVVCQWKTEDE